MSARFLIHLVFLLAAVLLALLWTHIPILSLYTVQAIAALVMLYLLNHTLARNRTYSLTIDGLIFTIVTLLLVTQTGGLSSPLFFLLYLLLFGLALLFEALPTLIFSLALALFFLGQGRGLADFFKSTSLILAAPLALFFGNQYLATLKKKELPSGKRKFAKNSRKRQETS